MDVFAISTNGFTVEGPPQGQWGRADWERIGDHGVRYEVINGCLYAQLYDTLQFGYTTNAASIFHQRIVLQCVLQFGAPAESRGLGVMAFASTIIFDPQGDLVQPDFLFIRKEQLGIIHDSRIYGVPDLIIEVLSPGNAAYDEGIKLRAYEAAGVPEYGVIDPATRTIRLYRLNADKRYDSPIELSGAELLTFACLPGISAPVEALFAGSPDTTI